MNARSLRWLALAAAGALLGGCGYNNLQRQDENVKAAWSEVVNQYQRRAELVPNLVKTVAAIAPQQQVLIGIAAARARLSSIPVSADVLNNPEAFVRYQAAQQQLTQSLANLLAVSDGYPQLKSNETFRDLRVQLESRESRIAQARDRYTEAVRQYNINIGTFPSRFTAKLLDFHVEPNLTVVAAGRATATAHAADPGGAGPADGQVDSSTARPLSPAADPLSPAQPEPEPAAAQPPTEPRTRG